MENKRGREEERERQKMRQGERETERQMQGGRKESKEKRKNKNLKTLKSSVNIGKNHGEKNYKTSTLKQNLKMGSYLVQKLLALARAFPMSTMLYLPETAFTDQKILIYLL